MKKQSVLITFECALCGDTVPVRHLSAGSLQAAGSDNRIQALMALDPSDQVCQECEDDEADEVDTASEGRGRTDIERFEFSGLTIDPARLQAYHLNY